jgi:DNA polymerase III delta subunit
LVGSYVRWRAAIDAGETRRVTWVAGDQPILIEDVVTTTKLKLNPSDLDYVSLSYGPGFERDVWAAASQYPLTPGANRMILIRDADKLTRWGQLDLWMKNTRSLPGVYLVFVSERPEQLTDKKGVPAHLAGLRAPRGFLVRATGLSEDDAIAWVRARSTLDTELARYLLTRTGGNLAAAAAVCAKLALFEQGAGSATINALVAESPAHDFTDNLIAGDKRQALLNLPDLNHSDRIKAVALLDSRLDLLERLHRMKMAGQSWREVTGISPFLLKQYMPHARNYDPDTCTHRRQVLAVLDNVLRHGTDVGVMEAMTALW